jgi:transcriptional regulator with XRE-family HTH domain
MSVKGTTAIDHEIGRRIRTRRLAFGMTQERLSELLGITFQQLQKYEKGVNRVTAARLLDVARVFGVPVSVFYEAPEAGRGPAENPFSALLTNREAAELLQAFARLGNAEIRRAVVEFVKTAASAEARTAAGDSEPPSSPPRPDSRPGEARA